MERGKQFLLFSFVFLFCLILPFLSPFLLHVYDWRLGTKMGFSVRGEGDGGREGGGEEEVTHRYTILEEGGFWGKM